MPIPNFETLMLPLLKLIGDGQEHSLSDVRSRLAKKLGLSSEEEMKLLPSGRKTVFSNRVAWAKTYLQQATLIESVKRGSFQITNTGKNVLKEAPGRIDSKYLEQFSAFMDFKKRKKSDDTPDAGTSATDDDNGETPEEALEIAYLKIRKGLSSQLIDSVKSSSPEFFEHLVVDLLVKMGYGGSRKEAGEAVGKTGDEGIDGIIHEDRLGLDTIYLQAKKWEGTVGRPEIQKFVGALHGKRAKKGVFITTGAFSSDARAYVSNIDPKVVLIDGLQLAEYMIDFNLGVAPVAAYETKRIDSDYFDEE